MTEPRDRHLALKLGVSAIAVWAAVPILNASAQLRRVLIGEDYPFLALVTGTHIATLLALALALLLVWKAAARADARALAVGLALFAWSESAMLASRSEPGLWRALRDVPLLGDAVSVAGWMAFGLAWAAFLRFAVVFPRPFDAAQLPAITRGEMRLRTSWERVFGWIDRLLADMLRRIRPGRGDDARAFSARDVRLLRGVARFAGSNRLWLAALPVGLLLLTLTAPPWTAWISPAAADRIEVARELIPILFGFAFMLVALAGIPLLVVTYARVHGEDRQRMRWVLEALLSVSWVAVALMLVGLLLRLGDAPAVMQDIVQAVFLPLIVFYALTCLAIAIFRYGALDPDRAVRRTVAWSILGVLLTVIFTVVEELLGGGLAAGLGLPEGAATMAGGVTAALALAPLNRALERRLGHAPGPPIGDRRDDEGSVRGRTASEPPPAG